jgi:kumamolisin
VDTEVHLDIETAGALASGARIAVYFAPVTELGFVEAFSTAIHDAVNKPSVISVSWALAESSWSPATMKALDRYFREAAAMGVTICVASGDHGSTGSFLGEPPAQIANVDFPGSNPYVLCSGGTHLTSASGSILSEVVWDEMASSGTGSGGGVSSVFPRPAYQAGVNIPPSANPGGIQGRGVPDVAGNGDPLSGYLFFVDRTMTVAAGTSSVAPLWAALIARINQGLNTQVGFLNVLLYQFLNRNAFRDITVGNNGLYRATLGWDACTGLGSPVGTSLLQALQTPAQP